MLAVLLLETASRNVLPLVTFMILCQSKSWQTDRCTELQRYGNLFTRLASRTIHLEAANTLTTVSARCVAFSIIAEWHLIK